MRAITRARRLAGTALLLLAWSAGPSRAAPDERPEVDTLRQIGPALLACWRAPTDLGDFEVRVRLSLTRDGAALGRPRIVFARFLGGEAARRVVVRSVVDALAACTPLRLSPGLGGAIAGRPFTIRFGPPQRGA